MLNAIAPELRSRQDRYVLVSMAAGVPTKRIRELLGRDITDDEIREMARKCSHDGTHTVGSFKKLAREDMEAIYRLARA